MRVLNGAKHRLSATREANERLAREASLGEMLVMLARPDVSLSRGACERMPNPADDGSHCGPPRELIVASPWGLNAPLTPVADPGGGPGFSTVCGDHRTRAASAAPADSPRRWSAGLVPRHRPDLVAPGSDARPRGCHAADDRLAIDAMGSFGPELSPGAGLSGIGKLGHTTAKVSVGPAVVIVTAMSASRSAQRRRLDVIRRSSSAGSSACAWARSEFAFVEGQSRNRYRPVVSRTWNGERQGGSRTTVRCCP